MMRLLQLHNTQFLRIFSMFKQVRSSVQYKAGFDYHFKAKFHWWNCLPKHKRYIAIKSLWCVFWSNMQSIAWRIIWLWMLSKTPWFSMWYSTKQRAISSLETVLEAAGYLLLCLGELLQFPHRMGCSYRQADDP